jgi:hypothetical protein
MDKRSATKSEEIAKVKKHTEMRNEAKINEVLSPKINQRPEQTRRTILVTPNAANKNPIEVRAMPTIFAYAGRIVLKTP